MECKLTTIEAVAKRLEQIGYLDRVAIDQLLKMYPVRNVTSPGQKQWSAIVIRVTVEILPGGYAGGRRTIGLMHIANVSDLATRSDYRVDFAEGDNPFAGTKARACTVYVRDHDRRQSVWSLIAAAAGAVKGAVASQNSE